MVEYLHKDKPSLLITEVQHYVFFACTTINKNSIHKLQIKTQFLKCNMIMMYNESIFQQNPINKSNSSF